MKKFVKSYVNELFWYVRDLSFDGQFGVFVFPVVAGIISGVIGLVLGLESNHSFIRSLLEGGYYFGGSYLLINIFVWGLILFRAGATILFRKLHDWANKP